MTHIMNLKVNHQKHQTVDSIIEYKHIFSQLMLSFEKRVVMKDTQEDNASMWKQLAVVVDRLFLLTYALINLIITLCVYLGAATS